MVLTSVILCEFSWKLTDFTSVNSVIQLPSAALTITADDNRNMAECKILCTFLIMSDTYFLLMVFHMLA